MSFLNKLKRIYLTAGVVVGTMLLGGMLSSLYLRATSLTLECVVDGERQEFVLRKEQLITGRAVLRCQEKSGEKLCGPLTQNTIPIYIYVSPDLRSMYFAPRVDVNREKCHEMGLGYNPTFNICISMDSNIACTKRKTF